MENSIILNITELAKTLKISKTKAYELARRKEFPKVKLGKRILIPVDGLKCWITQNTEE
jgi:excisionase family DNA binding protein